MATNVPFHLMASEPYMQGPHRTDMLKALSHAYAGVGSKIDAQFELQEDRLKQQESQFARGMEHQTQLQASNQSGAMARLQAQLDQQSDVYQQQYAQWERGFDFQKEKWEDELKYRDQQYDYYDQLIKSYQDQWKQQTAQTAQREIPYYKTQAYKDIISRSG